MSKGRVIAASAADGRAISFVRSMPLCVPPQTPALRGSNHLLVSRRAGAPSLLRRSRKLLERYREVHLHGLGAAIAPTITIAAQLVLESGGALVASASTSTETLLDRSIEQGGAHEDEDVDRWAEEDGEEWGVSASPDVPMEECPADGEEASSRSLLRLSSAVHIRIYPT